MEVCIGAKVSGDGEVEKRFQFRQVNLNRGSGKADLYRRPKLFRGFIGPDLGILQVLYFVKND